MKLSSLHLSPIPRERGTASADRTMAAARRLADSVSPPPPRTSTELILSNAEGLSTGDESW